MGKANKGGAYYAVQKGRQQGIYSTWAECEAATKGYAGAVYKKFTTQDAAQQFVRGNGYGPSPSSSSGGAASSAQKNDSYRSSSSSSSNTGYATANPSRSFHPYAEQSSGKKNKSKANHAPAPAPAKGKVPASGSHSSGPLFNVMPSAVKSAGSAGGRKTVAYCDGSSIGNGKHSARAGWGVFFEDPELHHLNESRRLPGETQTNNRAELMAIIRACQLCPNDGRELVIMSDSKYSMDAVTKWLPNWKKNNFKTSTGTDVQNQDLIQQLDHEISSRLPRPKLEYVKGHAGIDGNEIVDRMAKYGASLPESDSRDLTQRSTAPENHTQKVELCGITVNFQSRPAAPDWW